MQERPCQLGIIQGEVGMCNAWLLLPRHGPDGARAHIGYAYGHTAAKELRRAGARRARRRRRALFSGRPRAQLGGEPPHHARLSQPYAHGAGAHEVTRPVILTAQQNRHAARTTRNIKDGSTEGEGHDFWRVRLGLVLFTGGSMIVCDGCCLHPTWFSIIRALEISR